MITGSSSLYNESAASSKPPNRGNLVGGATPDDAQPASISKGGRDIIGVLLKGAERRRGVDSPRKPLSGFRAAGIPKRFTLRVIERLRVSGQPVGPNPARERRRYRIELNGVWGFQTRNIGHGWTRFLEPHGRRVDIAVAQEEIGSLWRRCQLLLSPADPSEDELNGRLIRHSLLPNRWCDLSSGW